MGAVTKFRDIREKQVYERGVDDGIAKGFMLGGFLTTLVWIALMCVAQ
jgi:hypothetical protein